MPAKSKSKLSFQRALLCLCFFAVQITATRSAEGETSEKAQETVGAENFADAQKILGEMQKSLTSLRDSGRHLREMADRVNTFLPSEEETQKIGHLSEEMSSLFQINPNQLPLLEKGKAKLQSAIGKLGNKEEELAELKRMIDSLQSIYKLRFDQKDQSIKLQKELDKFTDYSRIAGLIGQPAKPFESLGFEFVQNEVDWNALVLAHFSVHWIMLEPLRKRIGGAKDGMRKLIAEYHLNNPQPPIPKNREMSAGGLEEGMDNLMAKLAASRAVIKEIDGNLLPISASMEDLKRVLSNDQLNLESTNDEKEVETLMRKKEAEKVEFQKIAKQKVSLQKVRDMHAKMVTEIVKMLEKMGRYVNFSRLEKKKFTDLARQFRNLRLYFWLSRWTGELHRMLVPLARAHAVNGENAIDENAKKIIATLDGRMHSFLRALGLEAAMEFELRKDAIDYGEEEKEEEHAEMTKNEEDNTVLKEVADGDGNMESKAEAEDEEEKQRKRQIQQWKMRVRMQVLKVAFAHRRLDAVFGFSAVEAPKSPTTQAEISSSSQRVQKPSPMSRLAPIESADGVSRSATELLYELMETLAALRQNGLRRKQILLH